MMKDDPLGIVGSLVADKYRVEGLVGEGGFALVYRAVHTVWQLPVAIKFFNALVLAPSAQQQELAESFVNEGKLLARLSSKTSSIVQAHDIGTLAMPSGARIPYLVLEWVDGRTLDDVLERERVEGVEPWTLLEVRRVLGPVALAMDVVHGEGVAHRDLKPANVLVLGGDPRRDAVRIKILDFGVAKMMLDNAHFHHALTITGRIVNAFTPLYGAPEQFSRKYGATGPWTDVYALALIAVEMLSGRPALEGADVAALSRATCDPDVRPTPRQRGAGVPDAVEAVFAKALAVSPGERHLRAGALWEALDAAIESSFSSPEWQTPSPSMAAVRPVARKRKKKKRSVWPWVAGAAGLAVAGVGALFWPRSDPTPRQPERASAARAESPALAAVPGAKCPPAMVAVGEATFFMGTDERSAPALERPAHQVKLSAYCIDVHEVTVDDYKLCADGGACREPRAGVDWPGIREKGRVIFGATCNARQPGRGKHPMNCIDWEDASAYCAFRGGRLPTEAEWEYAARGEKLVGRYPWGAARPGGEHVNACDLDCSRWSRRNQAGLDQLVAASDGFATTAPVGRFRAGCSSLGVCGLGGNVREWTADAFKRYSANDASTDRVVRGGGWTSGDARELARTHREPVPPRVRRHDIGLRCARAQR